MKNTTNEVKNEKCKVLKLNSKKKKIIKKDEDRERELWDNIKHPILVL